MKDVLAAQSAGVGRFIDVRAEPTEFTDVRAEGFVHAPYASAAKTLASAQRSERIYVIDSYGWYSEQVAHTLEAQGFSDVHVVDGGLLYWTFQGGPLSSDNPSLAPKFQRSEVDDNVTVAAAEAAAAELGVTVDLSGRLFPLLDVHIAPEDREEAIARSAAKRN